MTSYRGTIPGDDGSRVELRIDHFPPPKPDPVRLGVNFTPATTAENVKRFGDGLAYHRVFGAKLPSLSSGKMVQLPPGCVRHVSWKDWDEAVLTAWLRDAEPVLAQLGAPPLWLTYHHERDNDPNPNEPEWRQRMSRLVALTAGMPWVQHVVPIVTTDYLRKGGDPRVWWVDGCTAWGADRYVHLGNPNATTWPSADETFGRVAEAAATLGVPWMIPEWGDAGGVAGTPPRASSPARAAWMRDCYRYMAAPDAGCLAAGWWNIGYDVLAGDDLATMLTLTAVQAR